MIDPAEFYRLALGARTIFDPRRLVLVLALPDGRSCIVDADMPREVRVAVFREFWDDVIHDRHQRHEPAP